MTLGKNTLDGKKLLRFVERVEAIKKKADALGEDKKVIMAEAKRAGFLPEGIRAVMKARALAPSKFQEGEDLRDLYFHAAGLADTPPLFRHVETMARDKLGKDQLIERFLDLVPRGASITLVLGAAGGAPSAPVRLERDPAGQVTKHEVEEKKPEPPAKAAPPEDEPEAPVLPDVALAGAEELGRQAGRDDKRIIDNPFPFEDKRRPKWDAGWRDGKGEDGMGPQEKPGKKGKK
jgi:uncharacterized protein (UPF0335 family)